MSILKHVSVILVGLAVTVCQAEIAIDVPTPEKPFENPSVPPDATPDPSALTEAIRVRGDQGQAVRT